MAVILMWIAILLTTAKGFRWRFFEPSPPDQKPLQLNAESQTIPIGPSGSQWFYSPETKSYDLTRRDTRRAPFSFSTSEGTSNVTVVVAPELTTLVVIDMQNYFLHPSCNDHPSGLVAAQRTVEIVKKCRDVGIKVIWLNWGLTDEDLDKVPAAQMHSFRQGFANPLSTPHDKRCGFGCDLGGGRGRVLMQDEWNSQLYESLLNVSKPEDDLFINKNRVSGLWSDNKTFAQVLEKDKHQTLLFAGVNTNQCVLGTLLDAYYRGYDCILIEDCCATNTPGGQDVSILDIWLIKPSYNVDPEQLQGSYSQRSHTLMHVIKILVLAGLAAAQFPPRPEGRKILRSKFHENVTISYKEPNICELEDSAKSYAGHVHLPPGLLNDINGEKQDYPINTFFWFFESRSAPGDAPLAIWLNGGPGGSSLLGLFAENGPCTINNDSTTTEYNPWSWNNFVNILYIDQPNQVGFSYDVPTNGTINPEHDTIIVADFSETIPESNFTSRVGTFSSQKASNTANSTDQAAHALWHFAQIWFSEFPHYKPDDDKISLWTESYGGHYGPGFMRFFQEQNEKIANGTIEEEDAHYIHLDTLGIVNGLVDIVLQGEAWIEFPYNNTYEIQVFNESLHEELMTNWTTPGGCKDQLLACQNSLGAFDVNTVNHGLVNVKEICAIEPWCDLQSVSLYNDLGHGFYDIAHPRADPFPPYHILGYLSQEHVLAAIGSPVNFTAISMTTNSIFMSTNDFIHGGFLDAMAYLLDSGVSIHMIYGDRDYACSWIGGEAASLAVPYSRQADFAKSSYGKFQISDGGDGFAGLTRQLGNFSFTRLFQAGHMVPSYQPAAAYEHFMRATLHKDIFTGTTPVHENLQNDGKVFDRWLKSPAPEQVAPQCYVLEPRTCTEEVWTKVKEGKAKVENYYVVEILEQPEEVQKERLEYDEL